MPCSPENAWSYVQIVTWMHLTEECVYILHALLIQGTNRDKELILYGYMSEEWLLPQELMSGRGQSGEVVLFLDKSGIAHGA